jgi:hypothetical protein
MAIVSLHLPGNHCEWGGSIEGRFRTWRADGQWAIVGNAPYSDDLIAPWKPLRPKPKRKAGRAQWGVWVPCERRQDARNLKQNIYTVFPLPSAVVKRSAK